MSVELRQAWDQRLERLLSRMPSWLHSAIQWLRVPSRWWIRGIAALIFILGGALGFLPILGFWMLPLGLALIAEDVPGMKTPLERTSRLLGRTWRRIRR
jgi:hypothetical protein